VPYLFALDSKPPSLPDTGGRKRAGLVWSGSLSRGRTDRRAIPFEELLPLLDVPVWAFHSLQMGKAAEELDRNDACDRVTDLASLLGTLLILRR